MASVFLIEGEGWAAVIQFCFLLAALFCVIRACLRFNRASVLKSAGNEKLARMVRIGAILMLAAAAALTAFALLVMPAME